MKQGVGYDMSHIFFLKLAPAVVCRMACTSWETREETVPLIQEVTTVAGVTWEARDKERRKERRAG